MATKCEVLHRWQSLGDSLTGRLFLQEGIEEKENQRIRGHERTGQPLGDEDFINVSTYLDKPVFVIVCIVDRPETPFTRHRAL